MVEKKLGPRVVRLHAYVAQGRVGFLRDKPRDGGGDALADLLASSAAARSARSSPARYRHVA
ncbi:hypothetical protein [Streptomyces goshikiensis]|uniref:hypothetical protein n=1 Tax=Streptomyces goshikiensis TaxID=1942 RepID=UPI00364CA19E